ncbi:MAG: hypothetical protein K6F53_12750 [Lachnospiraceae bacterium]|nr:hypothetical protein [Lachnospiraceae bacterium]
MNKRKLIAPILMLTAGAITYVILLCGGIYSFRDSLLILLLVLIVFYLIGRVIQTRIDRFVRENEERLKEEESREGAVIEKEAPESEGEAGETGNANDNGEA